MRLPTFEDLSREQDEIFNLPFDGNYVVSGPPGTGKSVMALYRAQALTFDDREPDLLMFSNVLKQYTVQAAKQLDVDGTVDTFHRWFRGFWKRQYRCDAPRLGGDDWAYDWPQISLKFMTEPPPPGQLADLLVDEGQDLPMYFYRLAKHLAQNVTVFADENQQLRDENSTLDEIEKSIGAADHHRLTRNYRNTREIAVVALHYYCGGPSGIPELPVRRGDLPTLRHYDKLNDFVEFVARYARNHSDLSLGIACYSGKLQISLLNRLKMRDLRVPVETYVWNKPEHRKLDFEGPGIKIVNFMSLKGLEFDTLFVPKLDVVHGDPSSASTRMLFYVIMSRARSELHLSYEGEREPPIVADLPSDLLERI